DRAQELELGYFGRFDFTEGVQQRLLASTPNTPYRRELDLQSNLSDLGLYADAHLRFFDWLQLKGGVRMDLFTFNVLNRCAVQDVRRPSSTEPPGDDSCLDQLDFGRHREPDERASAMGASVMPRGTLIVGPFAGLTLSAAVGRGVRS